MMTKKKKTWQFFFKSKEFYLVIPIIITLKITQWFFTYKKKVDFKLIECPYCNESNDDSKLYCISCGKLIRLEIRSELPPIAGTGIYILLIIITYCIFSLGFIFFDKIDLVSYFWRSSLNVANGVLGAIIITYHFLKYEEVSFYKFYPQLHELFIFLGISQFAINVLLEFAQVDIFNPIFLEILLFSSILAIFYLFGFYILLLIVSKKILIKKIC
jgi:hypothetical protein